MTKKCKPPKVRTSLLGSISPHPFPYCTPKNRHFLTQRSWKSMQIWKNAISALNVYVSPKFSHLKGNLGRGNTMVTSGFRRPVVGASVGFGWPVGLDPIGSALPSSGRSIPCLCLTIIITAEKTRCKEYLLILTGANPYYRKGRVTAESDRSHRTNPGPWYDLSDLCPCNPYKFNAPKFLKQLLTTTGVKWIN